MESLVSAMFDGFYTGKRVLVTGHTGFKGAWLSLWLKHLGASVWGVSLDPPTRPNLYEVIQHGTFAADSRSDVRDGEEIVRIVGDASPDIVFHLAAQSLVRRSYSAPVDTVATNVAGTMHVLEAVRRTHLPCAVVVVTSDKCYENRGWEYGYRENDSLGGHDPYSMSKAAAELVTAAWRNSFFLPDPALGNVASARGGNVLGGGDYAEDRIVPDCVRALANQSSIPVRNPNATRPWQHVLDCLSGYLWLGACLAREKKNSPLAGAFNFGPGQQASQTVGCLVREILKHWPGIWQQPAQMDCPHEASHLHLAIDKAAALLDWFPTWNFEETVHRTVAWYFQRHAGNNADMRAFSLAQIESFAAAAQGKQLRWATPLAT